MMVPGEGRVVDSGDVAYYRDMVTIVRDRVLDLVKKGKTLEEVKASRPDHRLPALRGGSRPVDDGHVRRGGLQEPGRRQGARSRPRRRPAHTSRGEALAVRRGVAATLLACRRRQWRPAWRRPSRLRQPPQPGPAGAADAARAVAGRSDRPVGLARHRRLAMADGHAAQGRRAVPAGERGRAARWRPSGIRLADAAAGEACRAYGAGGILHLPGRLRISWQDDTTLKLETDTGQQTRLFTFGNAAQPPAEATFQGFSRAAWELPGGGGGRGRGRGAPGARPGASMRVDDDRA